MRSKGRTNTSTWGLFDELQAEFLWRERRGSLAEAHGGENEELAWWIHGGMEGGREVLWKGEERSWEDLGEERESESVGMLGLELYMEISM